METEKDHDDATHDDDNDDEVEDGIDEGQSSLPIKPVIFRSRLRALQFVARSLSLRRQTACVPLSCLLVCC